MAFVPKNPDRKKKAVKILEELEAAVSASGKGPRKRQFAPAMPSQFGKSLLELDGLLSDFALLHRAVAYSALLQVWLDSMGFDWPKGVFRHDLKVSGKGRRQTLNWISKARYLRKFERKTWPQIAALLTPDEYEANKVRAANNVRRAASHQHKSSGSPLGVLQARCLRLLGIDDEFEN